MVYSIDNIISDLWKTENAVSRDAELGRISRKIGANYLKSQVLSDLYALIQGNSKTGIRSIYEKLKLVNMQRSLLWLTTKYYNREFRYLPHRYIRGGVDTTQSPTLRAHLQKKQEGDIQSVFDDAQQLGGCPVFSAALLGTVAGVAYCGLASGIIAGAVTGVLYKLYRTYQNLGDPPELRKNTLL